MRYNLIALLLCLVACAPPKPLPEQPRDVDAAFQLQVQAFEATWGHTAYMTIEFGTLPTGVVGQCYIQTGTEFRQGTRIITISGDAWGIIGADAQQQLIDHELGHCALGRPHYSALDGNSAACTPSLTGNCGTGYPLSIMYPVLFGYDGHYAAHRDAYLFELFEDAPGHADANAPELPAMSDYFIK